MQVITCSAKGGSLRLSGGRKGLLLLIEPCSYYCPHDGWNYGVHCPQSYKPRGEEFHGKKANQWGRNRQQPYDQSGNSCRAGARTKAGTDCSVNPHCRKSLNQVIHAKNSRGFEGPFRINVDRPEDGYPVLFKQSTVDDAISNKVDD